MVDDSLTGRLCRSRHFLLLSGSHWRRQAIAEVVFVGEFIIGVDRNGFLGHGSKAKDVSRFRMAIFVNVVETSGI